MHSQRQLVSKRGFANEKIALPWRDRLYVYGKEMKSRSAHLRGIPHDKAWVEGHFRRVEAGPAGLSGGFVLHAGFQAPNVRLGVLVDSESVR